MVSRRSGCRSRSSLNGVVLQGMSSRRRAMSPCPVVGRESCEGCVSSGSSRAEVSFGSVVSGPAGQWLAGRQDQSPCGRGDPLSSIGIDGRLVVGPSGCDDVVVVGDGKQRHNLCFFQFGERTKSVSRMSCTSSPAWKRGSPLAPVVVVVGEGQVNLVSSRLRSRLVPW